MDDNDFETIYEEDHKLRQLPPNMESKELSSYEFSIAATYKQLNFQKQINQQSPSKSYLVQVNSEERIATTTGAIHYRFVIKIDQRPEITIKKRFSEFYEFMESLKHYYSQLERVEKPFSVGRSTNPPVGQQELMNPANYFGYHVIPNLYKPPVTKVVTTWPESYFSEDEKIRGYYLRNFLLKVLTHSHLAECPLTIEFLRNTNDSEQTGGPSIVSRGKKWVSAVVESVMDAKNKYFDRRKEPSECEEIKQQLDFLCKFVREYNQKMKCLYDNCVSVRASSHDGNQQEVLKGLIEDMDVLQYMVEDTWVTFDSLLEAEYVLHHKKTEKPLKDTTPLDEANQQAWIQNTEAFLKKEKTLIIGQVQKDCEFLLDMMSKIYHKFTSLETTSTH